MKALVAVLWFLLSFDVYATPGKKETYEFIENKVDLYGSAKMVLDFPDELFTRKSASFIKARDSKYCNLTLVEMLEEISDYSNRPKKTVYERTETDFSAADLTHIPSIKSKVSTDKFGNHVISFHGSSVEIVKWRVYKTASRNGGSIDRSGSDSSLTIKLNDAEIAQRVHKAMLHLSKLCEEPF